MGKSALLFVMAVGLGRASLPANRGLALDIGPLASCCEVELSCLGGLFLAVSEFQIDDPQKAPKGGAAAVGLPAETPAAHTAVSPCVFAECDAVGDSGPPEVMEYARCLVENSAAYEGLLEDI